MHLPTPLRGLVAVALLSLPGAAQDAPAPTEVPRRDVVVDERVTLSVRDLGEGDAVLMLTGGPGFSGDTTLDLFHHVARTHRAILPDQRGTGASKIEPFDPSLFSMETAISDLEAIRAELELDSWRVAGHSWGGILAMAYAAEHPERVDGLLLIDPGGLTATFMRTYQTNLMQRLDGEAREALMALRPTEATFDAYAEMARESNRVMAPAMVEVSEAAPRLLAFLETENFEPRVALAMQPILGQLDLREAVTAYEGPVRVVQGAEDPIGRATVDAIVEAFMNAELHVIEGAGHWPEIEVPDALFAEVDAFLGTAEG